MSYMSLFEKSARNSVAISVLNKMRHWLQGRQSVGLSDAEKNVMKEALDILESPQFDQIVIRSFQGLESSLNSSVLPISIALDAVIRQTEGFDQSLTTESLKTVLTSETSSEGVLDKDKIVDFLNQAIQFISDSNLNTGSNSLVKSHSRGL